MDLRLRGDDEKGWVLQIFPTWLRMQVKTVSARLSNTLSRHLRAGGDPCFAACAASTRELQGARGLIGSRVCTDIQTPTPVISAQAEIHASPLALPRRESCRVRAGWCVRVL